MRFKIGTRSKELKIHIDTNDSAGFFQELADLVKMSEKGGGIGEIEMKLKLNGLHDVEINFPQKRYKL